MAGKSSGRAPQVAAGTQARLRVTQTRSTISHIARNRATIKALGLHGIGSTSIVPDNEATRGMVRQVRFLVSVEEVAEEAARGRGPVASDAGQSDAGQSDAGATQE